ncbi:MAG: AbrB/MazE/SpoVT family DNA-binding domain-containing protein [Candidatus Bathyarchaeia archaeon]
MTITVRNVRISKGLQITIPVEIREKYNLKDGDELILVDLGTEIIIRPARKEADLTKLIGRFETDEPFDAVKEHDTVVSGEH